jgi:hypothetical protein
LIGLLISVIFSPYPKEQSVGGVKVMNLTWQEGLYEEPSWSSDGKHFAVWYEGDMWIVNSDTYEREKVLSRKGFNIADALSWRNKEKIYYSDNSSPLRFFDLITKRDHVVIKDDREVVSTLSVNPMDNNQVAIQYAEPKIGLYNLTKKKVQWIEGYSACWSFDGKFVFYKKEKKIYVVNVLTGKSTIVKLRADFFGYITNLRVSSDGKWIAFYGETATSRGIYISPLDGSGLPEQIIEESNINFDWSPAGDKIIYITVGGPRSNELFLLNVPVKFRSK